ncbi:hypothetical protein L0222_16390 [bacterium]|nr:hypothetical protein [bacterium]MCI0601510.1 hypothetical protein [bacterium]
MDLIANLLAAFWKGLFGLTLGTGIVLVAGAFYYFIKRRSRFFSFLFLLVGLWLLWLAWYMKGTL